jgi:Family of unknown function (DUF6314)
MELEAFSGRWRLERQILDLLGGTADFEGRAEFVRAPHGLIYEETGELRLPGGPKLRATRRYLWFEAEGVIEVRFEDGRFFHAFDPRVPHPAAHHECPPDSYGVTYVFADPCRWTSRWEIRGPRKAQVIRSTYCR